jgi:hypothetical protein
MVRKREEGKRELTHSPAQHTGNFFFFFLQWWWWWGGQGSSSSTILAIVSRGWSLKKKGGYRER